MKTNIICKGLVAAVLITLGSTTILHAQGVADNIKGLSPVLEKLYTTMMPKCEQLSKAGRAIGGFAALWYISSRVWKSLANAEAIDFYPLFRPFVLGFCITFFPMVMALIDGILQPTVSATNEMVKNSDDAIAKMLLEKEKALKSSKVWQMYVGQNSEGDKEKWLRYTHNVKDGEETPEESIIGSLGSDISFSMAKATYRFKNSVKEWLSEILRILFEAAALCINAIRTFQRVILAILGPFVFAIAIFDGLQHTLTAWLAKYINIFLWLPVCNILGSMLNEVQVEMLKHDASQIYETGDTFFSPTDSAFLIFMVIGIVSYMTVPTIAGYIVQAGGGGALTSKITSLASSTASGGMSRVGGGMGNIANAPGDMLDGYRGNTKPSGISGAMGTALGNIGSPSMADKLSGKTDEKS
ncbi:conjugative transposon protein TraJ [Pedobacter paludis]|uniref:Conjugative transposon protein TraJ n=1 Tax=Pedobacter paludis TaxID=2203212 RepID=A0A317F3X3_9SPHI|nr:conjugative transposon protein TraJ [Pedobacter paludis]PWS32186.1 conjugative transposon protein TraJ [Pedobacter paludis]